MAVVTYPGVYVEEVSSGVRPIAAASTSTAAFIGVAEKGSLTEAVKIYNYTQYQNLYGGFLGNASFLPHAVLQYFNNGGSQCYIVRVAGANTATADLALADRGAVPQQSLTISAVSPGVWGNTLAVVITDGTSDAGNEFNLFVHDQTNLTPLESFENLSMVPGTAGFVETATSGSNYIRVAVNAANTNVQAGTSVGSAAPAALGGTGRSLLLVNLNNDGYQEIDLNDGVGAGAGQVADLDTAATIAGAIQFAVRALAPLRATTPANVFSAFTCTVPTAALVLTSGVAGLGSSVNVAPSTNAAADASGLLNLGTLQGGVETLGGAVTRPANNPLTAAPAITLADFYLVGDNAVTAQVLSVTLGSDGDPIITDQPYIAAFPRLDTHDDVSLIAVPGIGSPAVMGEGMNYAAVTRPLSDCFFIGDMPPDHDTVPEAQSFYGNITPKNSYGAVYVPWLQMLDPTGISPEPILVPPSGYMAGMYAQTDARRGVWKAPAGTASALAGTVGLAVNFTDVEQGNLNPINVNVLRNFPASGIVIWGARTVNSDPEYNYVPVRRTAIFLRVSIYRGIQWAVFEPNDEDLWASLRLNISAFMRVLFRQGAFQGGKESDAFFVKCDAETTTQDDINLGIVNVLIGFAPLRPAEFVVVKISQMAGQTS